MATKYFLAGFLVGALLSGAIVYALTTPTSSTTLHLRGQDVTETQLRAHFRDLSSGPNTSQHLDFSQMCAELRGMPSGQRLRYLRDHPASPSLVIDNDSDVIHVVGTVKHQDGNDESRKRGLDILLEVCAETAPPPDEELARKPPAGGPPTQEARPCLVPPAPPAATSFPAPIVGTVSIPTSGPLRALDVVPGFAYVSTEGCIFVIDTTNPSLPLIVGAVAPRSDSFGLDSAFDLEAVNGFLYAPVPYGGLQVFDLRDPKAPAYVATVDTATVVNGQRHQFTGDVAIDGNFAYVASTEFHVVDLRNRNAPGVVSSLLVFGYGGGVEFLSGHAYLKTGNVQYDGVQIVDVRDPANPSVIGALPATRTPGNRTDIALQGTTAYLLAGDELQIFDVSTPSAARKLGSVPVPRMGEKLVYAEGFVYITVSSEFPYGPSKFAGLQIVDVRTPEAPAVVKSLPLKESPRSNGKGIRVVGDHAYVLVGSELQILDASALRTPP
jgi:hypothetical protein